MSDIGAELVLRACGSIQFDEGGTPSFRFQSGDFLAAVVDNGVGDVAVDFLPGNGASAFACAYKATARAALAASGLVSISVTDTSDTRKRFMILQEQAAGAASALADVDFDFQIWTRPGI